MRKKRVVLVDDHRLMLEAVRMALETDGDFDVVASTTDALEAPNLVAEHEPDVVLLDVMMPGLDGLTCLERIRRRTPEAKVVVLSASDDPKIADAAYRGGANAFALKQIDPRDLGSVLRQAVQGAVFQTFGTAQFVDRETIGSESGLTRREFEVLEALANGLSNQEIATQLFLAEQTVKYHLSNIYRKLEAKNRTEAVRNAVRRGLVANPIFGAKS
jgi:DNA-binding NarL/FixJ family response regulator